MYNENQLKIVVESNMPSDQALKRFQKKLYQLQKTNQVSQAADTSHIVKEENQ